MTVVEGIDQKDQYLKDLIKTLKIECACGGTFKDNRIELQGDHRKKVKDVLMRIGFSAELIDVR
jgi:translation initiation factor 1